MIEPAANASRSLYKRALRVMPGGASRNSAIRKPHPLYAAHASGCRITDVDGAERIDFANNMASLIHGHAHPAIVAAVTAQLAKGTASTLTTEAEVRYAEYLCSRNTNFEKVRFVNSGTEAVMGAVKAARSFTGRPKIAKSEGAYHGLYDYAEVSQTAAPDNWGDMDSPASVPVAHGTPPSVLDDVVIIPYNDPERALAILDRHADQIACVLLDVMPHWAGLCPSTPRYAAALQEWTADSGALLVVDEVITLRTAYGGAQQNYNLAPDITAMGKIIGGGFPVGAIAGRAEIMELMNPLGDQYLLPYSGTFSANPITMNAGLTAMELYDHTQIEHVNRLAKLAIEGINDVIGSRGTPASVTGAGSMFRIHMRPDAPTNYRESRPTPVAAKRLKHFHDSMLDCGILLIYSGAGAISTPMSEAEIEQLVAAVDKSLVALP
ncbi:MAG: aspartate aminotransferase family protein [Acidimicrobiia bacterium]|nr:aspartate aminotransferase family protein [Acidimicrobiia bacterium]MYG71534.1 aspartate aminotransferase family protein [Acidimicrobiia bacterium]